MEEINPKSNQNDRVPQHYGQGDDHGRAASLGKQGCPCSFGGFSTLQDRICAKLSQPRNLAEGSIQARSRESRCHPLRFLGDCHHLIQSTASQISWSSIPTEATLAQCRHRGVPVLCLHIPNFSMPRLPHPCYYCTACGMRRLSGRCVVA